MRCLTPRSIVRQSEAVITRGDDIEGQNAVDCGSVAVDGERNSKGEQLALGIVRALAELLKLKLLEAMPKGSQMAIPVLG